MADDYDVDSLHQAVDAVSHRIDATQEHLEALSAQQNVINCKLDMVLQLLQSRAPVAASLPSPTSAARRHKNSAGDSSPNSDDSADIKPSPMQSSAAAPPAKIARTAKPPKPPPDKDTAVKYSLLVDAARARIGEPLWSEFAQSTVTAAIVKAATVSPSHKNRIFAWELLIHSCGEQRIHRLVISKRFNNAPKTVDALLARHAPVVQHAVRATMAYFNYSDLPSARERFAMCSSLCTYLADKLKAYKARMQLNEGRSATTATLGRDRAPEIFAVQSSNTEMRPKLATAAVATSSSGVRQSSSDGGADTPSFRALAAIEIEKV